MCAAAVRGLRSSAPRPDVDAFRVTALVWSLHRQSPRRVLLVGLLLLTVIAALDALTSVRYSFSIFYLLVVVGVSATGRRPYVVPTAALAAGVWSLVELLNRGLVGTWLLPLLWNSAARFAVLYFSALLVAAVVGTARQEREMSRTDPLTGLRNRRDFYEVAGLELSLAERSGMPLSALYLDIDGFKAVNDVQGHTAGDRLLNQVATTLCAHMRRQDPVARLGGDEFVVLLPHADGEAALSAARRAARGLDEMCDQNHWPVRCSIGVATYLEPPRSVDELLAASDALMYDAKRAGRGATTSTVVARVFPDGHHLSESA